MKPLVFVPNKSPHDYSKAWDFGDLVFCTQGELNNLDVLTMQSELEAAMEDAQPDDYILISSLSSLCGVACAIFAHRFGRLNLLLYKNGRYVVKQLTFTKEQQSANPEQTSATT